MSASAFTPEQQDEIGRLISAATNQQGTLIRQLQGATPPDGTLATAGDVKATIAAAAPAGWLLLDGSTKNTADYPDLAAALGAVGSTFVLPDCRGRALIGAGTGTGLTARTLKATGGTEKLVVSELPAHNHTGTTGTESASHTHTGTTDATSLTVALTASHTTNNASDLASRGVTDGGTVNESLGSHSHSFTTGAASATHTHSFTTANTGSGDNDSKMQPWIAVNWIVKT